MHKKFKILIRFLSISLVCFSLCIAMDEKLTFTEFVPSKKITPKPTSKVLTPKPYGIKEDLSFLDKLGNTALHHAIFNKSSKLFLETSTSRISPLRPNDFGQTPYNLALEMSHDPEVKNEDVVLYLTSLLPKGTQQRFCIDYSDAVPFKGVTQNVYDWHHDVETALKKNVEKLESKHNISIDERELIIFHAFSTVVDLFIKPLGIISIERKDKEHARYFVPGVIIDRKTEKVYHGFFSYFVDDRTLYHRLFERYPKSWIILGQQNLDFIQHSGTRILSGDQKKRMSEIKKTVYSLTKPHEKKPSEFYKLSTKKIQKKLDSAQNLDICATYQGLPAVQFYDPVNDIEIYVLKFNSAQPTLAEMGAEKLASLRKQLSESVEKNFISDDKERMTIINSLLDEGVDINVSIEKKGLTVLMKAISELDNPEVIEFLIEKGAWVNSKGDNARKNPLSEAAVRAKPVFVKLLLDYGARVNATLYTNFTPLMAAVNYAEKNDPQKVKEVMKLLLDHGADLSFTDKFGKTVFEMTTDKELLNLLEQYKPKGFKPKPFITPQEKKDLVTEERPILTEKPGLKIPSKEFVPSKPILKKEK